MRYTLTNKRRFDSVEDAQILFHTNHNKKGKTKMITMLIVTLGVTVLSGWIVGQYLLNRLDQADRNLTDLENLLVEKEVISTRDLLIILEG